MTVAYLKKAAKRSTDEAADVGAAVAAILDEIEAEGEPAALRYAAEFDRYDGNIVLTRDEIDTAAAQVPEKLKDDIRFSWDNIRRFAEAQMATVEDMEIEVTPGLIAGQKAIPCQAAGCYTPGGRYSHVASALMTVTTAKVAGCGHITACSPPRPGIGIAPAIVYSADLCGADTILALGGVQGVAAMAFGLFGLPKADILVGPGNQFVAEAKRILFGRVGIDMFAGPTNSLILADQTADPHLVAWDLVGQAEHGYNSPVWLATTHRPLAERVLELVPRCIATLPELNRESAAAAWRDMAEVMIVPDRETLAQGRRRLRARTSARPGRRPRLVPRPAAMLRLAVPRRRDDGGVRRQVRRPQPCAADLRRRALYRRPLGPQIHEAGDLAARDTGRGEADCRGDRADFPPRRHGGPRPHRRYPAGEILPRREVRPFGIGLTRWPCSTAPTCSASTAASPA